LFAPDFLKFFHEGDGHELVSASVEGEEELFSVFRLNPVESNRCDSIHHNFTKDCPFADAKEPFPQWAEVLYPLWGFAGSCGVVGCELLGGIL